MFVTVRAAARSVPFTDPALNAAVVAVLGAQRAVAGCDVYAYCLMPDHLHVVAAARESGGDVLAFVERCKSMSTRAAWRAGHRGRLWQPRFHDHVVRREESLLAICEYVLANPVRAGLVERAEEYAWAGAFDPIP